MATPISGSWWRRSRPIADHQRLADAFVRTPAAGPGELQAARQRVDAAFTSLAATDAAIGASLHFTPDGLARRKRGHVRVETVRKEWDAASRRCMARPPTPPPRRTRTCSPISGR